MIVTLYTPYIPHIMGCPWNKVILLGTHPAHPVYWFDFTLDIFQMVLLFRYISNGFTFQMIFRYSLNDIFPFQMVSFEIRWFYSHIWFQMIFRFRWFSDGKRHAPFLGLKKSRSNQNAQMKICNKFTNKWRDQTGCKAHEPNS